MEVQSDVTNDLGVESLETSHGRAASTRSLARLSDSYKDTYKDTYTDTHGTEHRYLRCFADGQLFKNSTALLDHTRTLFQRSRRARVSPSAEPRCDSGNLRHREGRGGDEWGEGGNWEGNNEEFEALRCDELGALKWGRDREQGGGRAAEGFGVCAKRGRGRQGRRRSGREGVDSVDRGRGGERGSGGGGRGGRGGSGRRDGRGDGRERRKWGYSKQEQ